MEAALTLTLTLTLTKGDDHSGTRHGGRPLHTGININININYIIIIININNNNNLACVPSVLSTTYR
jgi:hypothetical protein